jgi:hypothetical protein
MFCAAIPATLAVGVHAQARQRRADQQAEIHGKQPAQKVVKPASATVIVVIGLAAASLIYHSQMGN